MINSAFKPWIYWYSSPGIKKEILGIKGGQLNFLSKSKIKQIDEAAKEILNKTGVKIPNEKVLQRLDRVGAKVDYENERVMIPDTIVKEVLEKTPKIFRFAGRNAKNYITLDTEKVYFVHGIGTDKDGEGPISSLQAREGMIKDRAVSVINSDDHRAFR